jgi:hypothetical protein
VGLEAPDTSSKRLEADWTAYQSEHGGTGGEYEEQAAQARMEYIEDREIWLKEYVPNGVDSI